MAVSSILKLISIREKGTECSGSRSPTGYYQSPSRGVRGRERPRGPRPPGVLGRGAGLALTERTGTWGSSGPTPTLPRGERAGGGGPLPGGALAATRGEGSAGVARASEPGASASAPPGRRRRGPGGRVTARGGEQQRPRWGSARRGGSAGPRSLEPGRRRTAGARRFSRPGPAPARPRRPEAAGRKSLPAPAPSPQSPSPSQPIKMAAATAPRGPPRQPAPRVRRRRGASGATAARAIFRERGGRGVPLAPTRSSEGPRSLAHPLWCRDPTRSRRPPPPRVLRASPAAARKPASDESPGETRL